MDPDWAELVTIVRQAGRCFVVEAVVLAGSFARGEADDRSDIDLLALMEHGPRAVRVGCIGGRWVEVLYATVADLDPERVPPRRATFAGARVLFDPKAIGQNWLDRVNAYLASTVPPRITPKAYAVWDLCHALHVLESLAREGAEGAEGEPRVLYLRNHFVEALVTFLYEDAGVWLPSVRRQLDGIERFRPSALEEIRKLLSARDESSIAVCARRAFQEVTGDPPIPHLRDACAIPLA